MDNEKIIELKCPACGNTLSWEEFPQDVSTTQRNEGDCEHCDAELELIVDDVGNKTLHFLRYSK